MSLDTLSWIALALLGVVAIVVSAKWFWDDLQRFVAPDNADRDAIEVLHGIETPESRAALEERMGPARGWRDALTGITGLLGLLLLFWLWFA